MCYKGYSTAREAHVKQPDLFSIYLSCAQCGAKFHRITKRKIFCSQACGRKADTIRRQQAYDEYKAKKIAAE